MLSFRNQIVQKLDFGVVGRTYERRIVRSGWHVRKDPVIGLIMHRINGRHHVRAGDCSAFVPLYAESDYDYPHGPSSEIIRI